MSPFRIIGQDGEGVKFILSAMISTNATTGLRKVYILHKPFIPEAFEGSAKSEREIETDIAYSQSTKSNSTIVGAYIVNRNSARSYELYHVKFNGKSNVSVTELLSDNKRTLFDCQKSAMEHYCGKNKLDIISIL